MKKRKKLNKKIFYILIIILIIILGIFIYKNVTKKSNFGNNMSSQEIVDNILNINFYKANVTVEVNSNKNKNKYILNQECSPDRSIQEVIEPSNIQGVRIIQENGNLKIENTTLNLSQIFENYQGLEENALDINSFVQNYKNYDKSNFEEKDTEIIMKTKNINGNKYTQNKILYIDKQTKKPIKLIIQDNNQNTTIFIQYNEIELKLKKYANIRSEYYDNKKRRYVLCRFKSGYRFRTRWSKTSFNNSK